MYIGIVASPRSGICKQSVCFLRSPPMHIGGFANKYSVVSSASCHFHPYPALQFISVFLLFSFFVIQKEKTNFPSFCNA
jgi:hypothetical protein